MRKKGRIGAHTSAAGGSFAALYQGQEIGASTIQLFTSNQKQWQGREIPMEEVTLWHQAREETGIDEVMSHASYLLNLGSPKIDLWKKSQVALREEIERCHLLQISYLNFHPGVATDGDVEGCLDRIVKSLLQMEDLVSQGKTRLLLETTAGQGSSVGHTFEHLSYIIQNVGKKIPIGVTIDTCHIFVAGYDIRTSTAWEKTLSQFDETIGLSHLCAFHINDSMKEFSSKVDRHASLGKGQIGIESFRFLQQSPKTRHLPKYLETPEGPSVWKREIALLSEFYED